MKGRALLEVTAGLFVELLKVNQNRTRAFRVIEHALPDDAWLVRIHPAGPSSLYLELESEQFPPLNPARYHDGVAVLESPICRVDYEAVTT